ncbi:MAG: 50S ribosomal protein L17 [Candidatus Omnitrophota bacterium]
MRHRKKRSRLNRSDTHRKAALNKIAGALFVHQAVMTTKAKAREARRVAERLITIAKANDLTARRRVFSFLRDDAIVRRLFSDIMPLFSSRIGGYTRIVPVAFRRGDGAEMVLLELTEKMKEEEKKPKKAKARAKAEKPDVPQVDEKPVEVHKSVQEMPADEKEEKTVEEGRKDRAKKEDKRVERKGFFKKFFRRRTNM